VPQQFLLMFVAMPLWLAAGAADWALHRRARIEATAGVRESVLHTLMFAEMGVAVLAVLLLEVNAGVLALCMAAFMAHELTVYVDLRWAAPRRSISPLEQMVHSVQEILPLSAIALLASLHWDQALSLVGLDGGWDAASFAPVPRRDMFPPAYVGTVIAGGLLLAGCYAEELWRCKRAAAESKDR
jgi:hypothetical protein